MQNLIKVVIAIILLFVIGVLFGLLKVIIPIIVVGGLGIFGYRKYVKRN